MKLRLVAILLGLLLVVAGGVTLGYEAITYTMHPDVIDLGPLTATTDVRTDTVPLPPIAGAVSLLIGLTVLYLGIRRRSKSDSPDEHSVERTT